MPRAANDRDVGEALLGRLADAAPHRGLALEREVVAFGQGAANGGHRLGHRREQVAGIAPGFDEAVPESFAVLLAGRLGELVQGVVADVFRFDPGFAVAVGVVRFGSRRGLCHPALEFGLGGRELGAGRQVDEAGRDVVLERPAQGDPLRAEVRERVEGSHARLIGRVDEQRHGRAHRRVLNQVDQAVRV